jgi:hypothetical protein
MRYRTHDQFEEIVYDDMYTPLLQRVGLFAAGCPQSTLRRSRLWLTGKFI